MRPTLRALLLPCAVIALTLSMLGIAWAVWDGRTLDEYREAGWEQARAEARVRELRADAARDTLLRGIQTEIEQAPPEQRPTGSFRGRGANIGEGLHLLLGTTSYAWLVVSDVKLGRGDEQQPEVYPNEFLEESGLITLEGNKILLRPRGEACDRLPHELAWFDHAYDDRPDELRESLADAEARDGEVPRSDLRFRSLWREERESPHAPRAGVSR